MNRIDWLASWKAWLRGWIDRWQILRRLRGRPTFRLDECLSSKGVVAACQSTSNALVELWPSNQRGQKDHEWLPTIATSRRTIVTTDSRIIDNHITSLPLQHAGVVVIQSRKHTMTQQRAVAALSSLKHRVRRWEEVDYSNSLLFLADDLVRVARIEIGADGNRVPVIVFEDYPTSAGFDIRFYRAMANNCAFR